jgi:hypothetical protein
MLRALKNMALSLLAWQFIVAFSIGVMFVSAKRTLCPLGPEEKDLLAWMFVLGVVVVLTSWPVCRRLNSLLGVSAGLGLGLVIPHCRRVAMGAPGGAPDIRLGPSVGPVAWNELEWDNPWIAGWELAGPSAIARAVVGFLQARKS